MLNRLCLLLSPIALLVILGYSFAKRFTRWSHLILGLALGIAPTAAWIAVRGSLDPRILVLTLAVLLWVAGFDVLYACQDYEHDRSRRVEQHTAGLWRACGVRNRARGLAHGLMLLALVVLIILFGLGPLAVTGIGVTAALLLYEHSIVSPGDLRRLNAAFFTLNGIISVLFFIFIVADMLRRR